VLEKENVRKVMASMVMLISWEIYKVPTCNDARLGSFVRTKEEETLQ
jgi:hypothetical protein